MIRVEREVLDWPQPVGLGRVLGLAGLAASVVQTLTWPFLGTSSNPSLHATVIAATALGSTALVVLPVRALTSTISHFALGAAIALQTATAATTGDIGSPYLGGYTVLVLVAALFASWRTVLMTLVVIVFVLLALAVADFDLSGTDAALLATAGTVSILVGSTSSLLAIRHRRELQRGERRLQSSRRASSFRRTEALTDPLTGVGNRRAFDRDLAAALVDRRAGRLLLAMIDVDGLKTVNDIRGHLAGDLVLKAIAAALRLRVRAEDRVYRLGGDEFAALSTSLDPDAFQQRLGQYVEAHVPEAGRQRASVGVARAKPGEEPSTIMSRADTALYKVKHQLSSQRGT